MSRFLNLVVGVSFTALATGYAYAQDEPEDDQIVLDSVTVVAQKVEESLQDVPISVAAVSGESLTETGAFDTQTLQNNIVGLTFTQSANIGIPVIRGVGSSNIAMGSESSVATYVDGVYRPFRSGGVFALNNIEQVEVLRGPQGALFGRNSTGGVIQVITRTPSSDPYVDFNVGLASYDKVTTNLYATTGLAENLAVDIAANHSNQGEGWGYNLVNGQDANYNRETSLRSKLLWTPTAETSVTVSADYNKRFDDTQYRSYGGAILLDGLPPPTDLYDTRYSEPTRATNEQWGASLVVDHDFGWADFKSISGYQNLDGFLQVDNDATEIPLITASLGLTGEAYTQELQLTSPVDSPFDWIVGAFYMDADQGSEPVTLGGLALAALGAPLVTNGVQNTRSYAVFGQVGVPITDQLKIIGGLRYTQDEQELVFDFSAAGFPVAAGTLSDSFDKVSPRVVLEYTPNEDLLFYASYNEGFKSGTYNTTSPFDPIVEPEDLIAYEVGGKAELYNGRMRLNGAAYYYDYTNLQIFVVDNVTGALLNLDAEIYGLDADVEVAVSEKLTLKGGVALIETEQKVGPDAGNEIPRAPSHQIIFGGTYDFTDNFWFTTNLTLTDSYAWELDNRTQADSREMLSASLNWQSGDSGLYGSIWGKNLLDEEYFNSVANAGFGDIGQPGEPLTFGATVGVRF